MIIWEVVMISIGFLILTIVIALTALVIKAFISEIKK